MVELLPANGSAFFATNGSKEDPQMGCDVREGVGWVKCPSFRWLCNSELFK
jgi:hypothetical protein